MLDFLVHLNERKLSARSQARRLVALRQLFQFSRACGIISVDPTEDIDLPRFGRMLPEYLSTGEVDRPAGRARSPHARGARDIAMIETLHATGQRVAAGGCYLDPALDVPASTVS